jgi:hypothetical protein
LRFPPRESRPRLPVHGVVLSCLVLFYNPAHPILTLGGERRTATVTYAYFCPFGLLLICFFRFFSLSMLAYDYIMS